MYWIGLSHIFEIPSISNEKHSISFEIPSISIENLAFRSKYYVFGIKYFEILSFSHLVFEIQGISSKLPGISKKVWNFGFSVDSM